MRAQGSQVIAPLQTSLPVRGGGWAKAIITLCEYHMPEALTYDLI